MPHLVLDHSPNLRDSGDFPTLCRQLAQTLVQWRDEAGQPVYPIGGTRVRAIAVDACCIGDGALPDAAYVHASFKVGAGRSEATLRATAAALFDVMRTHFAAEFERRPLALSLELAEFSEAGTLKHNNLHVRFKAAAAARDSSNS